MRLSDCSLVMVSACCPSYKLYEDDEGAVTPVRAEAPVLQPVPYHTTTTSLQPQVSQWKPTVLGPPSKVIGKTSDPDEKRERAAAAAEQREEQHRTRGGEGMRRTISPRCPQQVLEVPPEGAP